MITMGLRAISTMLRSRSMPGPRYATKSCRFLTLTYKFHDQLSKCTSSSVRSEELRIVLSEQRYELGELKMKIGDFEKDIRTV
jgi:hypothetical protein